MHTMEIKSNKYEMYGIEVKYSERASYCGYGCCRGLINKKPRNICLPPDLRIVLEVKGYEELLEEAQRKADEYEKSKSVFEG
jgi:hypothetical protein